MVARKARKSLRRVVTDKRLEAAGRTGERRVDSVDRLRFLGVKVAGRCPVT